MEREVGGMGKRERIKAARENGLYTVGLNWRMLNLIALSSIKLPRRKEGRSSSEERLSPPQFPSPPSIPLN